MKKTITFTIILSLIIFKIIAQGCLPNGIVFDSQAKIDDFKQLYPNCTEIQGDVIIHETVSGNIKNLYTLDNITKINGELNIYTNTDLKKLTGLHNVTEIGEFLNLYNNDKLSDLDGINSLTSVGELIQIKDNDILTSIYGLSGLNIVHGDMVIQDNLKLDKLFGMDNITEIEGEFDLKNNAVLDDLGNLSNLTSIGDHFEISDNNILFDLSGLENLNTIGGNLNIKTNSNLTHLTGLDNLTEIGGHLFIDDNDHLKNLNVLSSLTSVGNYIRIYDNDILYSIAGLSGLNNLPSYLSIQNNSSLENLSGLDNITDIGGNLEIINNDDLDDFSGLNNLSSIGGNFNISYNSSISSFSGMTNLNSIDGYLNIFANDVLNDISALASLTSIDGFIAFAYNNNLISLDGLQNIDPATIQSSTTGYDDINLHNNTSLSECEVLSICEVLNNGGSTNIHDNASGCDSEAEVTEACTPAECTSLTDPVDGATDVPVNTNVSWATSEHADGYNICVGYTQNCDIFNGDVGNVTTWNPPQDFDCGQEVFVLISPYNNSPYNTSCSYESFQTEYVEASAGADVEICFGDNTQLQASGGNGYSWYPTTGLDNPNIANPVASPEVTTTYTVTVSNDNGCTDTDDVTVFVNPNPVPNASATDETGNDFNDGTATCNPTSGTPAYTYEWSTGETTQTITGLSPGDYIVTVTDSKSCFADDTVTINEFICPQLSLQYTKYDISCYGECDGSMEITGVTNGIAPFSYNWNTGDTTAAIDNLCPGDYTVTVTDAKNCSVISDIYTITQPDEILLTETHVNVSCYGDKDGSIDLTATGGTQGFTYQWNNGAISEDLIGIGAGSYTVTVTDYSGCTNTLTTTITEPDILVANASATDETANGANDGTATCNPEGGNSPYLYSWSNGQNTQSISGLAPGNYTVTVTDSYDCTSSETVTVNSFGCPNLTVYFTLFDAGCYGECNGSITITNVENATPPLQYQWSNGETSSSITKLCARNYSVTITDSLNCQIVGNYTINQNNQLFVSIATTDVSSGGANDGTATANASGGSEPYTYSWSNGQNTQEITNLSPGSYKVTIEDANHCTITDSCVINSFGCGDIQISYDLYNVSCYGLCDGSILITNVQNANFPLSYNWSNGADTSYLDNLCAGYYYLTVTDNLGCTSSDTFYISQPDLLRITSVQKTDINDTIPEGAIEIDVEGGNAPYTYHWSGDNGYTSNEQNIYHLSKGYYLLTVIDSKQCTTQSDTIWIFDHRTATFDLELYGSVKIYPNPADGIVFIEFDKDIYLEDVKLQIYSLSGEKIINHIASKSSKLNVNSLSEGIYILKIFSPKGAVYKKISIIR